MKKFKSTQWRKFREFDIDFVGRIDQNGDAHLIVASENEYRYGSEFHGELHRVTRKAQQEYKELVPQRLGALKKAARILYHTGFSASLRFVESCSKRAVVQVLQHESTLQENRRLARGKPAPWFFWYAYGIVRNRTLKSSTRKEHLQEVRNMIHGFISAAFPRAQIMRDRKHYWVCGFNLDRDIDKWMEGKKL